MNLSQLMQGLFKNEQIPTAASGMSDAQVSAAMMARIRALTPGQIISGEVVESTAEGTIKLLIGAGKQDGFMLSAKMTQNITLPQGKHVMFEVKNNGKVLSLSPLYENINHGANVSRAIEAAGLTVNEETVQLVQHLMEQGMPIDKESLTTIYQKVSAFREAPLQDILDLQKLGLPITKENLEQLASYKEQTHQLTGAVETIAQQLGEQVVSLVESGNADKAMQLMKGMLENLGIVTENTGIQENVMAGGNQTVFAESTQMAENNILPTEEGNILSGESTAQQSVVKAHTQAESLLPQRLLTALQSNDIEAFTAVLKDVENKDFVKEFLQRELLFLPKEVEDKALVKDKIKKLYDFVTETEGKLKTLQLTDTKVFDTVGNTKQNIQFLNQLNEMYAYIQVPLKMGESDVNGELYVYSNKKNLSAADGEITAFLHLDMKNLGPVDIFVSLKDNAVKTKFSVADDEMIDFLYEHMDILNARLQKRGYTVSANIVEKQDKATEEKTGSVMEQILEEKSNIPAFAHYSFDARA